MTSTTKTGTTSTTKDVIAQSNVADVTGLEEETRSFTNGRGLQKNSLLFALKRHKKEGKLPRRQRSFRVPKECTAGLLKRDCNALAKVHRFCDRRNALLVRSRQKMTSFRVVPKEVSIASLLNFTIDRKLHTDEKEVVVTTNAMLYQSSSDGQEKLRFDDKSRQEKNFSSLFLEQSVVMPMKKEEQRKTKFLHRRSALLLSRQKMRSFRVVPKEAIASLIRSSYRKTNEGGARNAAKQATWDSKEWFEFYRAAAATESLSRTSLSRHVAVPIPKQYPMILVRSA